MEKKESSLTLKPVVLPQITMNLKRAWKDSVLERGIRTNWESECVYLDNPFGKEFTDH